MAGRRIGLQAQQRRERRALELGGQRVELLAPLGFDVLAEGGGRLGEVARPVEPAYLERGPSSRRCS